MYEKLAKLPTEPFPFNAFFLNYQALCRLPRFKGSSPTRKYISRVVVYMLVLLLLVGMLTRHSAILSE